jgi:hypothetical protein
MQWENASGCELGDWELGESPASGELDDAAVCVVVEPSCAT